MAGSIQQINAQVVVIKIDHTGGDGNPALLLHGHPIGGGGLGALFTLHFARLADHPAVINELFGDRRFTGIGVGDDRKGASFLDLFLYKLRHREAN